MGGDYSRTSFDPLRDYIGVGMQQGHPLLDAEGNELAAILERRIRAGTVDTIGRSAVPRETPNGFEIRLAPNPAPAPPTLTIGRGRIYVDGLLAENHGRIGSGAQRPTFDRARLEPDGDPAAVLDEMISTAANDFIGYSAQPYLPAPPALPATPGPHLVYLDVWRREVTALKDARLLEPALGGIDTATRWQTVWQVRLLDNVGADAACGARLARWDALIAPSPARLTTATITVEDPADPCLIPPGSGYRGLENQYYRVEIHTGGAPGAARFKWSRDNASVGARIVSIEGRKRLRVRTVGRDSVLRLAAGDWVEITDDRRELGGLSGDMRRILSISDSNEIELTADLSNDLIPAAPDSAGARNSRVIKWDQRGQTRRADGSRWTNLDAPGSDGLIEVPAAGSPVVLEAGITVAFAAEPAGGWLRAHDHWCFAARTEGAQIEILDRAPPLGIHHHHARLALVTFPATVRDCRTLWPPAEECGCTVCVSAEEHNSGRLTIQRAIAELPAAGGTVCLGPGDFLLGATPVVIARRESVRLRGHGFGSELGYAGAGGAIEVRNASDIRISDLAVTVASAPPGPGAPDLASAAVHIAHSTHVTVRRTRLKVESGEGSNDFGVSLGALAAAVSIEDNVIDSVTGIGISSEVVIPGLPPFTLLNDLRVADNVIGSTGTGVSLQGLVFHFGAVRIQGNSIVARETGIRTTGLGLGVPGGGTGTASENWSATGVWIAANSISFARGGSGIASGILDLKVLDNDIVAQGGDSTGEDIGSCIRLVAGGIPLVPADAEIVGNRLGTSDGYALSIEAPQGSLLIKRNVMRDCARGAVTVEQNVSIRSLSFDNNVIERVATVPTQEQRIAVKLSGVADARIVGNSVRGVGSELPGLCIGFDINGAAKLDLSHNLVTDVGRPVHRAVAIGVYVHGAVLDCAVTNNQIFDSTANPGTGSGHWCGIAVSNQLGPVPQDSAAMKATAGSTEGVDSPPRDAGAAQVADTEQEAFSPWTATEMPANFAWRNTVYTLGNHGIRPLAPLSKTHIRIAGNIVSDAHPSSVYPLAVIVSFTGNCIFSDNQCTLLAGGSTPAIVSIIVPRIVAANNVVRRQDETDAMSLLAGISGDFPSATVIGNITFGRIMLNGAPLEDPPFAPLNIIAQ